MIMVRFFNKLLVCRVEIRRTSFRNLLFARYSLNTSEEIMANKYGQYYVYHSKCFPPSWNLKPMLFIGNFPLINGGSSATSGRIYLSFIFVLSVQEKVMLSIRAFYLLLWVTMKRKL